MIKVLRVHKVLLDLKETRDKGDKGSIGDQGPIGPIGATGHQGAKGDTGYQGAKGDTGYQGAKGDTGDQGVKGDTGAQGVKGDTGDQGVKGDTGAQGVKGDTGAQGVTGDTGDQGPKGDTGAQGTSGGNMYLFSTSESVNNDQYIGLGNSSSNIIRNTLVIANHCTATTLVFSIRELAAETSYTATLFVNGNNTLFKSIIPDGSKSYSSVSTSMLALNQFDLVTIHLSYLGGGALSNGICATLLTVPN